MRSFGQAFTSDPADYEVDVAGSLRSRKCKEENTERKQMRLFRESRPGERQAIHPLCNCNRTESAKIGHLIASCDICTGDSESDNCKSSNHVARDATSAGLPFVSRAVLIGPSNSE